MSQPLPENGLPPGTPVLTPTGEVPVEALRPGDLVIAVSGAGAPFQAVAELRRAVLPAAVVRLREGALADGTPQRDLLLPPAQALLIDGRLVEAGALLCGPGAVLEQAVGVQEVIRVVLAGHDAILAAGAALETARAAPEDPPLHDRAQPDAALRALLALRGEAMGWLPPAEAEDPPPGGSLEEVLAASALAPALPPDPLARR